MSSRLLLTGVLAGAAVRRKRRDDGAIFAVAKIRDTDRHSTRTWTAFANDPELIELLEGLRVGEPIAISGPFSVNIAGSEREPTIEHRITIDALLDTKRRRKPKGAIAKEQRIESDELDLAPLNDALPF
jgi:hypothetical protein